MLTLKDIYKVNWTRKGQSIQKNSNINSLDDVNVNLQQRLCTLTHTTGLIKVEKNIPKKIMGKIKSICNCIVTHVDKFMVSNQSISNLELIFKEDREGKIWLLLCTRVRLRCQNGSNVVSKGASFIRSQG